MCVGFELFQGWQMSTMDFTDYAAQKIQAGVGGKTGNGDKRKKQARSDAGREIFHKVGKERGFLCSEIIHKVRRNV